MTKLTDRQRGALDKAVLAAIVDFPQAPKAADIARTSAVQKVIGTLPKGKDAFRYLDNALQRLRKQGCIGATRGGRWRAIHGRP